MDRKYAIIPAYEPDGRLLEIIEDAMAEGFQVIVVDDGSSDDCQQYFKQAEYMATVLHHSENKGKGAALKTGFARIASMCEADDVVVTLDTLILSLLVEILGMNRLVAKLITEVFFFVISYLVQRNEIFKRARKGAWSNVY